MAYTDYALGEDAKTIRFSTAVENRGIALSLAEQAHRTIRLFTTDMDPAVFDRAVLVEAMARLAREHSRARIHILVQDSGQAVTQGHRLVELARRLSSRVEIRKPIPEYRDLTENFMVVDGKGYLLRVQSQRFDGQASFHDPFRCRELVGRFEEIWQRSHNDLQLRRLHL